jgi:hypothetical protein
MTLVEFAYWVDGFEAYHAGSHMEVANVAVQQAILKKFITLHTDALSQTSFPGSNLCLALVPQSWS